MSLKQELLDLLPEYVTNVKVDRANVHGLDVINVKVKYADPSGAVWEMDINFAEKNKMTATAMAANIKSRIKFEAVEGWENEGGNGTYSK